MNMLFKEKKAEEAKKNLTTTPPVKAPDARKGMNYADGNAATKAPQGGGLNVFAWGKQVEAFIAFVMRVTDNGKKKPSQEEFNQIVSSYKSLNALQRYSASSKLAGVYPAMDAAVRANDYSLLELQDVL